MTSVAIDNPRDICPQSVDRGRGVVEFAFVAGKTAIVRARSNSPLKLLTPRSRGGCGWLFTSTYGGGLVDGDDIRLDAMAGENTRCLLSTQASTKVYRTPAGSCRQSLHVRVSAGARVAVIPDPIVCFAGAAFEQDQRFDLAGDAGVILIDWLTSGRRACGERWAFSRYESRVVVTLDGAAVFNDVLLLDPRDGPIGGPMRMGQFDCFATVLLIGEPLGAQAKALLEFVAAQPAPAVDARLVFSASPCRGGVVMRIAGPSTEVVGQWIRERLDFVPAWIGQDPWARKQ